MAPTSMPLIAAELPELLPDVALTRHITVVNLADALGHPRPRPGPHGEEPADFPYALFVADEKGLASGGHGT